MTSPATGLLPGCSVYVDGVRMADGQVGEADTTPVALTDLRVVWGRDNTLDQPSPATCTFRVMDVAGGQKFLEVLGIGKRITVRADASIYPDPTISTITDPGFELAANGSTPSTRSTNAKIRVTDAIAHTLSHSARIEPLDASRQSVVIFPPAPFSENVSAWDAIPRPKAGQEWRFGAAVRPVTLLGSTATFEINPVYFTSPDPAVPYVIDRSATATKPPADGAGWIVASGALVPPESVWLGLAVSIFPHGPAWNQVPPAVSWNSVAPDVVWRDLASTFVDDLAVLAPAAGALRAGVVFDGRVSDMAARFDTGIGATVVEVIAQDDTAELANRYVGAAPYSQETLLSRFSRIVTDSGQRINYTVDAGVQTQQISYQDVDAQPATGLLQKLAQSVVGVLWAATSIASGPYLRLEDVNARPPLFRLVSTPPGVRNLFTRPSFEDNVPTGIFTATNASLTTPTASSKADPNSGARVLRANPTVAGSANLALVTALRPPVVPGKTYRVTAFARSASASPTGTVRVDATYRDSGGTTIGTFVSSATVTLVGQTWTRLVVSLPVAPVNAASVAFTLNMPSGHTIGVSVDWDAIMVHEVASSADPAVPYFDGDTPSAGGTYYGWDGTPRSSTSSRSGTIHLEPALVVADSGIELDACSVLLEPMRWQQDTQDASTRVVVTWKEQTANPTPPPAITPTDRDYLIVDQPLEDRTGRRRVQVSTMLATEADAQVSATTLLGRLQAPGWRLSGLTLDLHYETLDPDMLARIMRILDASTRLGLPILLTNLPDWSPSGDSNDQALYLEGGRFTYDLAWRLELLVSSGASQGSTKLRWIDVPVGVPWLAMGDITWAQLSGVGV